MPPDDALEPKEPEDLDEVDEEDDDVVESGDESLEEIAAATPDTDDSDDESNVIEFSREERLESLSIRAVPRRSHEFVCASCHLVKSNSQLADKKRSLCRDCV